MIDQPSATQASTRMSAGRILLVTGAVLSFALLLCFAAKWLLAARTRTLSAATHAGSPVRPLATVGEVRMQLFKDEGAGEKLKAEQRSEAQHYRWVDRTQGIVQIPIDVAIELESRQAN